MRNASNRNRRTGFTMIEVLASMALMAIAIVGGIRALSSIAQGEAVAEDREHLINLTYEKYDEVISTENLSQSNFSGDFQDRYLPNYTWEANLQTTGLDNVSSVKVTVTNSTTNATYSLVGLVYIAPQTAGTNTPATTGTTGG